MKYGRIMQMGTEEHLREFGQAAEDYASSRKRLATLLSEMDRYKNDFTEIAKHLSGCHYIAFPNATNGRTIPTQERFEQVASELKVEFERKTTLAGRLRTMGIDVAEDPEFPFAPWKE